MMIILQCARGAVHFHLLSGSTENSIAFFWRGWCDDPEKMKQFLKLSAAPIAALSAQAFVATATPGVGGSPIVRPSDDAPGRMQDFE